MASVSQYPIALGSLSGASGSADRIALEQHTVDHVLCMNVSALGATTLGISVKTSCDGTNFAEIATLSITSTGVKLLAVPTPLSFIRVDWTLSGGATTATVAAALCYDKRR
jgi:hypothetical protein